MPWRRAPIRRPRNDVDVHYGSSGRIASRLERLVQLRPIFPAALSLMPRFDCFRSPRRTIRRTSALIALVAIAAQPVAGQNTLDEGVVAYRKGDYARAIELWSPLAEKGNAMAQYSLGAMFAEGKGVPRDDKVAFTWFKRAAEQGDPNAQYNLGASYAQGLGVARNDAEAAKWFKRAAEQGMAYAQLNLGLLYAAGSGVPQDSVESMTWLQLALFALPPGAARSDVAKAMQDVSEKMTSEQREEARERARAWKAKPETKPEAKADTSPAAK